MGKIGNWSEINAKCGTSGSPANKCPNKSEILAAGATVAGSYANNQLPQLDNVQAGWSYYLQMTNTTVYVGASATYAAFNVQSFRQNAVGTQEYLAITVGGVSGIITSARQTGTNGINAVMSANFAANTSTSIRVGYVTVKQTASGRQLTITISQAAYVKPTCYISIYNNGNGHIVAYASKTVADDVTVHAEFTGGPVVIYIRQGKATGSTNAPWITDDDTADYSSVTPSSSSSMNYVIR